MHEDVRLAQSQLVLLKSKIAARRRSAGDLAPPCPYPGQEPKEQDRDSRFERVTANSAFGCNGPGAQVKRLPSAPARPREAQAREALRGGQDRTRKGMVWDPSSVPEVAVANAAASPSAASRSTARSAGPRSPHGTGSYPELQRPASGSAALPMAPSTPGGLGLGPSPSNAAAFMDDAEAGTGGPLVPCPDCGRRFNVDRLDRHARICKKVFQQKRKQFNSAANRLGEFDNASELIANARRLAKDEQLRRRTKTADKVPKWKQESLEFRAAILEAKASTGDEDAHAKARALRQTLAAAGPVDDPSMVRCPHCGRTFNKEAGERHIAICVRTFGSRPGGGRLIKGGSASGLRRPSR